MPCYALGGLCEFYLYHGPGTLPLMLLEAFMECYCSFLDAVILVLSGGAVATYVPELHIWCLPFLSSPSL